ALTVAGPKGGGEGDRLLRVAVRVALDERESGSAGVLELAPQGFDEVDREGEIELGVYTDAAGLDRIAGRFAKVAVSPVEAGWEERWREFHRPVLAGGLWIGPPWLEPAPGVPAVVIDPGRAFGTGAHPTTRLCIELLLGLAPGSVLDVRCGSGVLSIAAVRL